MESPLYILLGQQSALQRHMEIVAQNIANANTTGFKARDLMFEEYVKQPDSKNQFHFGIDKASIRNTSQGMLLKTDNPLDVAISGNGYFAVRTSQGIQYTRQGSFQMDGEGNVTTVDGFPVLDAGGQGLVIPRDAQQIAIGSDGSVATEKGTVGKLQITKFEREQAMQETYGGYFTTSEAGTPDVNASVTQGMLEASNVKPVIQVSNVIEISRSYQRVSTLINSENERMRNAIRTLGRV